MRSFPHYWQRPLPISSPSAANGKGVAFFPLRCGLVPICRRLFPLITAAVGKREVFVEQQISFVPAQRRRGRSVSQRTSFSKREAYACNIYTSHFAAPNGAAVWLATTILPRWGKHTKWLYIDFNLMLLNHYSVRVQSQAGLRTNRSIAISLLKEMPLSARKWSYKNFEATKQLEKLNNRKGYAQGDRS